MSAPIRRRRDGSYAVKLDPDLRQLLGKLAAELSEGLDPSEPTERRLFPPAYVKTEDRGAEAAYRHLVTGALVSHHREALATLAETARASDLTEPEVHAWLSAVGSLRLVLGTRLDVSEDMEAPDPADPSAPDYAVYEVLGQLQYVLVEAVAAGLPDEGRPEGTL